MSVRVIQKDRRGRRVRKLALHLALVMGFGLLIGPRGASGQEQGEGAPAVAEARTVEVLSVESPSVADRFIADRLVEEVGLVSGRPSVRPTRVDTPPNIDGRLDDEVWRSAAVITDFVQQAPLDGAPTTEETEVYVAYDSENIYIGFYAHYEDPSTMRANRVDRDRASQDDLFTVYFDTFLDQQRGYDFAVNGYGVQGDGIISAGGSNLGGTATNRLIRASNSANPSVASSPCVSATS